MQLPSPELESYDKFMKYFLSILLISYSLYAQDADILSTRGYISLNGSILKKGMKIKKNGLIKTGVGSFLKMKNNGTNSIIILGPNSEMELNLNEKDLTKQNILQKGLARWVSEKTTKKELKTKVRGLRTRQAVMGIRGTDYIVKVTPLFAETEVIVMDGAINFSSNLNKEDQKTVKKHQWGGLGGRFGNQIGDLIDLPKNTIQYFDDIIPNI